MDADVNVTSNVDGSNHLRRNCKYSKAVLTKKYAEMSSVTSPRLFILLIDFCSASDAEFSSACKGLPQFGQAGVGAGMAIPLPQLVQNRASAGSCFPQLVQNLTPCAGLCGDGYC